jgi:hypothetical protein
VCDRCFLCRWQPSSYKIVMLLVTCFLSHITN